MNQLVKSKLNFSKGKISEDILLGIGHVDSVSPPPHTHTHKPHRGNFLRTLAATQWEKKRRSKHLQSRLSASDDITSPSPQPVAEVSGRVPAAEPPPHGKSLC